jgi:hypothetical protein
MLLNLKLGLILAAVCAGLVTGAYFLGRWDGSASCDTRHATAQLKTNEKVREGYAKIDKQKPSAGDDAGIAKFLLDHVRQ